MPWSKTLPHLLEVQRHARQLAVDRVEKAHRPGGDETRRRRPRCQNTQVASSTQMKLTNVTMLGEMPIAGAEARHIKCRHRPDMLGHHIGDALCMIPYTSAARSRAAGS